jgi:hypothetical protein
MKVIQAILSWSDIDSILLVGGSSRLRRLQTAFEERTGTKAPESGLTQARNGYAVASDFQAFFDVPVVEFESGAKIVYHSNFRFKCPSGAFVWPRLVFTAMGMRR